MAEKNIGAVVVIKDNNPVGIFSERDYARKVILNGKNERDTLIKEVMTRQVIGVELNYGIDACLALMTGKFIRHLPVVDKENHLVGIVTDRDIREAAPSDATLLSVQELNYLLGKLKVSAFMTPKDKLITINPDTLIEEAAADNGTITTARGFVARAYSYNSASMGSYTGLYIANPGKSGSSTITNVYGLYIEHINAGGTINYALYSDGGNVYFGGNVGIGVAPPTKRLHVRKAHTENYTDHTVFVDSTFNPSSAPPAFTRYVQIQTEGGVLGSYLNSDVYFQSVRVAPYVIVTSTAPASMQGIAVDPYVATGAVELNELIGVNFSLGHYGTGNIVAVKHINIANLTVLNGGTVGAQYGIYIGSITGATNNYAIYAAGGQVYFASTTTIGASLYVTSNIVTYESTYLRDDDAAAWHFISAGTGTNYYNAGILIRHDSTHRWGIYKSADAAANLLFARYNDAGAWQGEALYIFRSNGYIGTEANLGVGGSPQASYLLYVYGDSSCSRSWLSWAGALTAKMTALSITVVLPLLNSMA